MHGNQIITFRAFSSPLCSQGSVHVQGSCQHLSCTRPCRGAQRRTNLCWNALWMDGRLQWGRTSGEACGSQGASVLCDIKASLRALCCPFFSWVCLPGTVVGRPCLTMGRIIEPDIGACSRLCNLPVASNSRQHVKADINGRRISLVMLVVRKRVEQRSTCGSPMPWQRICAPMWALLASGGM